MHSNAKLTRILGKRISKRRKQLGLSQEDVASKIGISRVYQGYVEQGRNAPSFKVLQKIAKVLKTSMSDFLKE